MKNPQNLFSFIFKSRNITYYFSSTDFTPQGKNSFQDPISCRIHKYFLIKYCTSNIHLHMEMLTVPLSLPVTGMQLWDDGNRSPPFTATGTWDPSNTETQNGWAWKGPLEGTCSKAPAQTGPPTASCQGAFPCGFWISPEWETPQTPCATCASDQSPS